jgi:hypothetical protein
MKRLLIIFCLLTFCLGVGQALYYLKDGFSTRRIHSLDFAASDQFDEECSKALLQPFYYIGRGRQCFAFASKDGKYVIKLPRTDIYKLPFWTRALPVTSYREKTQVAHLSQEKFILESFRIAHEELKDQTGLLAIHLGKSAPKNQKITLVDALGCKHLLPLETTSFLLQYKQPILIKTFLEVRRQGNKKEAEQLLDALLDAIVERAQRGILNRDRSFLRNYGFDGQKAYQIDVGSFFHKPEMALEAVYEKSIRDSTDPVREWLAKTDPEMLPYFDKNLKEKLHPGFL